MSRRRLLNNRVISVLMAIICLYAVLAASTDEIKADPKNNYNSKLTEASVKDGLGVPSNATVAITYGNEYYVEAYETYLVSVYVEGIGTYEGYWASATFSPDDGYVFGNIMMWNFDETLIKKETDIISNTFEHGKYTFYFTSKIGSDKCNLIRADKNGKNEKVIAKLKYRDEYTINSYHGGNLYFSDSNAFYKCNIEKKKITKVADCPFDRKLTNELYLLNPSKGMGEWGPYSLMTYNIKTNKTHKISDYCLAYGIEGKNIYLVTADKNFKYEHKNSTKIVRYNYKSQKSKVLKKTNKVYIPERVTSNYVAYYDTNYVGNTLTFGNPVTELANGKYKGNHNVYSQENGSSFLKAQIKDGYLSLYGSLTKDEKNIKDRYYRIKLDKNISIEYVVDIGTEQGSIETFNNIYSEIGGLTYEVIFTIKDNRVTKILMIG